ncbi:radical SAM protein [Pseudofrankia sp. DC12]|uniref:radical SAM protein n=1 Tax=Pseudofrankia sp. DC12 TaxID=683315 RepID=UPI0009FC64A5|nr:radical SAM protein [Pseudofrankia sp. DC12]
MPTALHHSKSLEVHVVDQCNLDCVACSHESPFMPRRLENPEALGPSLSKLWQYYRAPIIKLLGGEPLLHPNLDEIIKEVRAATDARIRIVTNGALLNRRHRMLRGIDEIHISAYAGIDIPSDDELQQIAASIRASITIQSFEYFRWHRSPTAHSRQTMNRVFNACQLFHNWQCHTVRNGWFFPCPPAATWGDSEDGINLLEPGDISGALHRLLDRSTPLETCVDCLGSVGKLLPHQRGWKKMQKKLAGAAVDVDFLIALESNADAWNECYEYDRTIYPSGRIEVHSKR